VSIFQVETDTFFKLPASPTTPTAGSLMGIRGLYVVRGWRAWILCELVGEFIVLMVNFYWRGVLCGKF